MSFTYHKEVAYCKAQRLHLDRMTRTHVICLSGGLHDSFTERWLASCMDELTLHAIGTWYVDLLDSKLQNVNQVRKTEHERFTTTYPQLTDATR